MKLTRGWDLKNEWNKTSKRDVVYEDLYDKVIVTSFY